MMPGRLRLLLLAAIVLPVLGAPPARAEDRPRPLDEMDVARTRSVADAVISPDGTRVAWRMVDPRIPGRDDDGPARLPLYLTTLGDVERTRRWLPRDVRPGSLAWSPDGRWLAYLARRGEDEHTAIWAIPADGGESVRLASFETSIQAFDWSPDGRRIAFVAAEPVPDERTRLRDKGFDQEIFEEDWQPRHVYLVDLPADPLAPGVEENEPRALPDLPGQPWHVRFSPDGKRLLVDLSPRPLTDDRYMFRRLHVIDATSGRVIARIANPGKLGHFDWSADGRTILLVSGADIHDPREGRLMAAPADGGEPRDLLPGLREEGHVVTFSVTGDGTILWLADVGVGSRIGRVSPDGSGMDVLLDTRDPVFTGMSADRSGRVLALVGESPSHPRELFTWQPGQGKPLRRTHLNPWLADRVLGRQEVVRWKGPGGLPIEGLLIHPVERRDGQRVPLIVVAHGGPESHYRNGWLTRYATPGQVAAGRGYAVLYPNYRGSTGYGVAFSKADQGDGGGREFEDVLAGIDHVVAMGLADPDRVGITGGSYGGFFTGWAATRWSSRFRAAVMFVGISDQLSKVGTTDIPKEMELVHWLTTPYENLQLFLDRSAVLHAKEGRTPLLILGGKEDRRVDPGQSMELYRALKFWGRTPVRLVRYPGEGHGNRRAASRLDYNLRMMRWFDHFLVRGGKELPPWQIEYPLPSAKGEDAAD